MTSQDRTHPIGSEWFGQRALEVTDNVQHRQRGVAARGGERGGSEEKRVAARVSEGGDEDEVAGQDGGERKEEFHKVQPYI